MAERSWIIVTSLIVIPLLIAIVSALTGIYWERQRSASERQTLALAKATATLEREKTDYEKIKLISELRERVNVVSNDLLELADGKSKLLAGGQSIVRIDDQLRRRTSDYETYEKQLAEIEGRAPRAVPLIFLKPGAPQQLRLVR